MAIRAFLVVSVLVWLPYGLYCLLVPGFLAEGAGVAATSPTGSTELRAMYGGLQAAVGVMALAALRWPELRRPYLLLIAFLAGGLGFARLVGVLLDGGLSSYTTFALVFEIAMVSAAMWLLRQPEPAPA